MQKEITLLTVHLWYEDRNKHELVAIYRHAFSEEQEARRFLAEELTEKVTIESVLGRMYTPGDTFKHWGDIKIQTIPLN